MIMKGWWRNAPWSKRQRAWLYSPCKRGEFLCARVIWSYAHSWPTSLVITPSQWKSQSDLWTTESEVCKQLLSLWHKLQQNGTGMRWLLCVVEMDTLSNMHVSFLSCLWAQLFIHLHKCLLHGLNKPVQRHILFSLSCSGVHLQIIQDVSLSQPEQLPGL